MGIPPQKHVVDSGSTSVTSTAKTSFEIAKGVINPDYSANPSNVRVGSIIKGIVLQFDAVMDVGASNANNIYLDWYVGFNIDGQQTAQLPNPGSVGSSDIMQQIFHEDGAILKVPSTASVNSQWQNPVSWRLYIKVPKSWEKLNRGDQIQLYFKFDTAQKCWIKVKAIYYEIFP